MNGSWSSAPITRSVACAKLQPNASPTAIRMLFFIIGLLGFYRFSSKWQIRRRQLLLFARTRRAIRAITLINFRTEMGVIFDLLAQLVNIEVGHRDFRTHQNN